MEIIEHEGIIESISDKHVMVRITSLSACGLCQAKSMCSTSNSEDKIIDIFTKEKVKIGQKVMILGSERQGFKAAWMAYLLPVILVVAVLAVTMSVTGNEKIAGIMSLAVLIPYFVILRIINDRLRKTFLFKIKPINE